LAENTARARSQAIFTEGAKWGAEQIRMAGANAAKAVADQVETSMEQAYGAARFARLAALVSIGAAALCGVFVALGLRFL